MAAIAALGKSHPYLGEACRQRTGTLINAQIWRARSCPLPVTVLPETAALEKLTLMPSAGTL